MTPEQLETALITELGTLGLTALPYPENPEKYYPEADPGEVLVRYEGRKVIDRDISGQLSRVKHFAEIVVVSRQVRDEGGAYEWLEKIYRSLEGFTLPGASEPLWFEVESFMTEKDGLWQFGQKWSVTEDQTTIISDPYYDNTIGNN